MIPEIVAGEAPIDAERLRDLFYGGAGCLIVRKAYEKSTMDRYNAWCEHHLPEVLATHANTRHPKQPKKRVINDVMERMSEDDPALLLELTANPALLAVCDALLGFARFGAVTTHLNEPGAAKQQLHVDYPCHVRSGPFWEGDAGKLRRMFTPHQLKEVLPHFSVQALVASDAMDERNGSTRVVPGSHLIDDVDCKIIEDEAFVGEQEALCEQATLGQGDLLIFNRRLVHGAGANHTDTRRNSLIMQLVWLFGVGQHATKADDVLGRLPADISPDYALRVKGPYPIDTTLKN